MVRIEFLGAWKDEDMQAVRDVTMTGIKENLKISVLPAYFEAVKVRSGKKFGNGVKITISLFPAGNGRMRRQTAQEITKNIGLKTGIPQGNISVTLDAPPQERRSYAEER